MGSEMRSEIALCCEGGPDIYVNKHRARPTPPCCGCEYSIGEICPCSTPGGMR
jgi:hypothetical protein